MATWANAGHNAQGASLFSALSVVQARIVRTGQMAEFVDDGALLAGHHEHHQAERLIHVFHEGGRRVRQRHAQKLTEQLPLFTLLVQDLTP